MRKKILIFTLLLTMLVCSACSGKKTNNNGKETNNDTTKEDMNEENTTTENNAKATSDDKNKGNESKPVSAEPTDLLSLDETSSSLFDYETKDDGIYIYRYFGDEPYVVIPEQIDGKEVVGIDSPGFKNNRTIKGIVIPGTINEMTECAFQGCDSLETVIIKDGKLRDISLRCFWLCKNLKYVKLPEGLEKIGEYAFRGCESLTDINIPDSVTTIDAKAFYECPSLKELNVPDSVTTPKSDFFEN